jgi:hypothetical protein
VVATVDEVADSVDAEADSLHLQDKAKLPRVMKVKHSHAKTQLMHS